MLSRITLFISEIIISLFAINLTQETINEISNIVIIIVIRLLFYLFEIKFKKIQIKNPLTGKYINPKKETI